MIATVALLGIALRMSGNFFPVAPFPVHCLLIPFSIKGNFLNVSQLDSHELIVSGYIVSRPHVHWGLGEIDLLLVPLRKASNLLTD